MASWRHGRPGETDDMATKKLAKELGLIRRRRRAPGGGSRAAAVSKQLFHYLIVIDFESTCWREKNHYGQEIIEFPAVLLNTCSGEIDAEFHHYVQPQEHPMLSAFCTELTGITQGQVEAGVPLRICLSQFSQWLQTLRQERNVVFAREPSRPGAAAEKPCAFVTWSDWDLGVCLQYECKRKQLRKPEALSSWIDLRATYKLFYNRRPKGLNGALQDLGIEFSGREHSGLDDARNTARLAWRMMSDGCAMRVTKCLAGVPPTTHPPAALPLAESESSAEAPRQREAGREGGSGRESAGGKRSRTILQWVESEGRPGRRRSAGDKEAAQGLSANTESLVCRSLVSPRTLLHGLTMPGLPGWRSMTRTMSVGSAVHVNSPAPLGTSLVLVSTTVNCLTETSEEHGGVGCDSETVPVDWEDCPLWPETDESCSYDAVALEDTDTGSQSESLWSGTHDAQPPGDAGPALTESDRQNPVVYKSSNTTVYSVGNASLCPASQSFKTPSVCARVFHSSTLSNTSLCSKPRMAACGGRDGMLSRPGHYGTGACDSFRIYQDKDGSGCSDSVGRTPVPPGVLSSSVNTRVSSSSSSSSAALKLTPPLCGCGRRARRMTVSNGGPNNGRAFYSCPAGKSRPGIKQSCGFFQWETALARRVSLTSTSLCAGPGGTLAVSRGKVRSAEVSQHRGLGLRPAPRT
ncbi:ERI1 exoribonuclease 2 isoform X2 [Amia ocellicauda]|uniref:ERI1 exoribonuclease 2 isoform X2 n=1 Tax=Amia ocellicauda TaxID=2972642 RepID=UPI003463A84C